MFDSHEQENKQCFEGVVGVVRLVGVVFHVSIEVIDENAQYETIKYDKGG